MILDENDIERLTKAGIKLRGANGEPIKLKVELPKPVEQPKKDSEELDCLRAIRSLLVELVTKPVPEFPSLKPPDVIVQPPEVIVNNPPIRMPQPIEPPRKWKFVLKKDHQGYTTDITATALE